ncbi:MAG: hypothetical protein ACR2FY_17125 [Pirellulaceae bacterium]
MNALILLLFAADPTGLQAAFESAETVDLSYGWTGFKVTLLNPETIKKLASLVEVKGEAVKSNALPGTPEIIRAVIRGKKRTEFWMIEDKIGFDGQLIDPADDQLWVALRAYFEPPTLNPEKGIPVVEDGVAKTLAAAMKGADKLEIFYRGVKMENPINESGKVQTLGFLKLAGDVTQNAKKPKDPVEIAFVNKETRIPIYLVGDTAYWGDNNKRWKSVKLTRDTMWRKMVAVIPKDELVDRTGFKAAVEAADSVELTHRGKTVTLKGETLEEIALLPPLGAGGGAMTPGNKFLEGKEIIDIVVRKDKETANFKLARDKDDLYLVFNQNLLGKLTNMDLWEEIQGQFPKTEPSAFPAKSK